MVRVTGWGIRGGQHWIIQWPREIFHTFSVVQWLGGESRESRGAPEQEVIVFHGCRGLYQGIT